MNGTEKDNLNRETIKRRLFLRFKTGCGAIYNSKGPSLVLLGYFALAVLFWLCREHIFHFDDMGPLAPVVSRLLTMIYPIYVVGGLFFIIVAFGTPRGGASISNDLRRAGVVNHAGEAPLLASRYKEKDNTRVTVLEFESGGLARSEWEDKRAQIETALNVHVAKITDGKNKRRVLLYTIPADYTLPSVLPWKDRYLSPDSFTLVLGESLTGPVLINLAHIPHILLGGSTGSGKSVLLKLLLMECIKKGAVVCVADFKGGVDFPEVWHRRCQMCFDEDGLFNMLDMLVSVIESRKILFRGAGCANLDEYVKTTGDLQPRYIFGCDEVAEVLDKNGLTKAKKELATQIESKLAVIARQGRAFGVHLILATQRPDARCGVFTQKH